MVVTLAEVSVDPGEAQRRLDEVLCISREFVAKFQ